MGCRPLRDDFIGRENVSVLAMPEAAARTRARLRTRAFIAIAFGGVIGTLACSPVGDTFDNPNRTEPAPRKRISLWTVEDDATNTALASGCIEDGVAAVPSLQAAPGQALALEVRVWVAEKRSADSTRGWWCSGEDLISRTMVAWVDNLSCWNYPSSNGVRVLSWEAIPTANPVIPPLPTLMSGTGYRMQLEVDGPGALIFEPNGTCDVDGHVALEVRTP